MANAKIALPRAIKEEGGFQNGKADGGNYYKGKLLGTKFGITPNAYFAYYKKEPTQDTIKNLTVEQALPIYKNNYWNKIKGDEIANESVADLMLFIVINSGVGMIKSIKQIANETKGSKIFAVTTTPFTSEEIKLLNALPQQTFFNNLKTFRVRFYNGLVEKKPSLGIYLKGWLNRLDKHVYSGEGSLNPANDNTGNLLTGILFAIGLALLLR